MQTSNFSHRCQRSNEQEQTVINNVIRHSTLNRTCTRTPTECVSVCVKLHQTTLQRLCWTCWWRARTVITGSYPTSGWCRPDEMTSSLCTWKDFHTAGDVWRISVYWHAVSLASFVKTISFSCKQSVGYTDRLHSVHWSHTRASALRGFLHLSLTLIPIHYCCLVTYLQQKFLRQVGAFSLHCWGDYDTAGGGSVTDGKIRKSTVRTRVGTTARLSARRSGCSSDDQEQDRQSDEDTQWWGLWVWSSSRTWWVWSSGRTWVGAERRTTNNCEIPRQHLWRWWTTGRLNYELISAWNVLFKCNKMQNWSSESLLKIYR